MFLEIIKISKYVDAVYVKNTMEPFKFRLLRDSLDLFKWSWEVLEIIVIFV